jgi:DNA-binding CsgD family transcriptional regulator
MRGTHDEYCHGHGAFSFLVLKLLNSAAQTAQLSARERQVLGRRAYGQKLKHIAADLDVAKSTVTYDLARVRKRLGVASDVDLSAIFAAGPRRPATERRPKNKGKPPTTKQIRSWMERNALRTPRGLRREPSRNATGPIISFPIPDVDWRQVLSPAEISVAEHALARMSSPQIADRRSADVRTVANPIASIYRKARRELAPGTEPLRAG